jgi:hypothetical protein
MQATISLLMSSLVFSTLAFNYQTQVNQSSEILPTQYQAQFSEPERPVPHRGSGRRDFMQKSDDFVIRNS